MQRTMVAIAVAALALSALAQEAKQPEGKPGKPAAASASAASAVEAKIRQSWEDFKAKKKDAYGATLTDDHTAIWIDGKARDKQAALRGVDEFTLTSYKIAGMKVTPLGASAAQATYSNQVAGAAGGQNFSANLGVTEVWVKRGGEWKCLRYHESELK
ncbi:MAG TPA: nuclear transport factor 2 family protein [Terriglobales bacterium]|nr:nuclear transport factor 2 family protein [Terriglobales bacterium]